MENAPSDAVDPGRWRDTLGYRSFDSQDAPPSDQAGMQYFDYEQYEAEKDGFQGQDEGGGEMWYDAESQPLQQQGFQNDMPDNETDRAGDADAIAYDATTQWYGEMVQLGGELMGMYNNESWEQTPALDNSTRSINRTAAPYDPARAQEFDDATSYGPQHSFSTPTTDYGTVHQPENGSSAYHDAPQDDQQDNTGSDEDDDDDEDGDEQVLACAHQNYYADDLLRSNLISALTADYLEQCADPAGLISLESVVNLDELSSEKWEIDKESAAFLNHVVVETNKDYMELLLQSAQTSLRDLEVEEPVLLTDPQMDMIRIMERSKLELKAEGLKPHKLNDNRDESLKWPAEYADLPERLSKKIDNEKLDLDIETIEYLKDIHDGADIDLDTWLDDERKRRARPQYVSPKLLPLSPPYSPSSMPDSIANIPLLSTPDDPNEREVAELDKMLRDKDDAAMQQQADDSTYSSLGIDAGSSSSPLRRKTKRVSSLKVSDPILPAEDLEPPAKKQKTVSFPEELHTLIPRPASSDMDTIDAVDETFAAVEEILKPLAAPAIHKSENDQLDEVDTTMRVAIPEFEVITPTLPWLEGNGDNLDPCRTGPGLSELAKTVNDLAKAEKKWRGVTKVERDLPWSAFASHLGKVRAEGDFDDGSAARYIAELDDGEVDLEILTYRPEKLQLLVVDEFEDDELEPAELDEQIDDYEQRSESDVLPAPLATPKALLPKVDIRPKVVQEVPPARPAASKGEHEELFSFDAMLRKRKEEMENDKKHTAKAQQSSIVTSKPLPQGRAQQAVFGGGLTQHMSMHGVSSTSLQPPAAPAVAVKPPALNSPQRKQQAEQMKPVTPTVSVPLPVVPSLDAPLPVVVSSTIMKTNQQLVRSLQKLLPTLEVIERDDNATASAQNTTATAGREADMTISPGTGLMFTSLQKLKQKPLPGQKSYFGIREHIASVVPRYEHLIVFVSGGASGIGDDAHIHPLDESDTAALTDLIGFGTTLDCEVEVTYTAGCTAELAQWTAAAITRHAQGLSSILAEETTWERFLRKAGMNTYAAQVLLDQLKPAAMGLHSGCSSYHSSGQYGASGLGAFVAMSAEERVYRFADVMGGVRVLQGVCKMTDGPLIPVQQRR